MSQYLYPIKIAALLFPVLALVLTLPYLVYHYKKFGAAPFLRGLLVYSFVLYLMCVYFLAILPLPDPQEVAGYTGAATQLRPFQFIRDQDYFSSSLNIAMFLPLGVYLRYFFRRGWKGALLLCFLGSLFCELTQLSALYGLYPRPYRLFDVDDLMLNTLGGMLGFWLTPVFGLILPSRDALDQRAYEKGRALPHLRRLFAFIIDLGAILLLSALLRWGSGFLPAAPPKWLPYALSVLLLMVALPTAAGGRTLGKGFFGIRIVRRNGERARWYQLLLCYGLFYAALWYAFYLLPLFLLPFCNRISGTKSVSTISIPSSVE